MTPAHKHDNECIFCKIAQKEIPPLGKWLFWEDEDHMARLAPFPNTKGFTILIPKSHHQSDILKMPQPARNALLEAASTVGAILEEHFEDVWRVWVMFEGTWVNHAHIKLAPMHGTGYLSDHWKPYAPDESHTKQYYERYPWFIVSYDAQRADDETLQSLAEQLKQTNQQ